MIVTSTVNGMNIDVYNYMFGSILAMSDADVALSVALSVVVLAAFIALYPRIFSVTFDESFARATGLNAGVYNLMIAVLTAVTIVVGMRIMGTMLISSLIIFPALTSMRVFSRFRAVVISSAIVSVVCLVAGIMLSCLTSLPAGAGIVAVNLAAFVLFSLIGKGSFTAPNFFKFPTSETHCAASTSVSTEAESAPCDCGSSVTTCTENDASAPLAAVAVIVAEP